MVKKVYEKNIILIREEKRDGEIREEILRNI